MTHLREASVGKSFKTGFSRSVSTHKMQRSTSDPCQLRLPSGNNSSCPPGSPVVSWHCRGALGESKMPDTRTPLEDEDGILHIFPAALMNSKSNENLLTVLKMETQSLYFSSCTDTQLHKIRSYPDSQRKSQNDYPPKSLRLHYIKAKNFNSLLKVSVKSSLDGDFSGN